MTETGIAILAGIKTPDNSIQFPLALNVIGFKQPSIIGKLMQLERFGPFVLCIHIDYNIFLDVQELERISSALKALNNEA